MASNKINEEHVRKGCLKAYLANRGIQCISYEEWERLCSCIDDSKSIEIIRCKDCKHFELDKPYVVQGVPVLGHEVCNAWGDGCKTDENGWCFLAERRTDG